MYTRVCACACVQAGFREGSGRARAGGTSGVWRAERRAGCWLQGGRQEGKAAMRRHVGSAAEVPVYGIKDWGQYLGGQQGVLGGF